MNRRASVLANVEAGWTKQKEFVALITWTRNASAEELASLLKVRDVGLLLAASRLLLSKRW
ncbi:hypothetical protein HOY82DRAFT_614787 [Tuber indicum]|nr:hypothetical protein HOY82DRAFT_614787 [Tuber indicum]